VLMASADEPSLIAALEFMRTHDESLSAVRYPRDNVKDLGVGECPPFETGKARPLIETETPDAAILSYGALAANCLEAVEILGREHRVSVYDARFAKPVDRQLIRTLLGAGVPVVTVEDHALMGGFGSAVVEAASDMGLNAGLVTRLGIPDSWIYQDSRGAQLEEAGLDAASIARAVRATTNGRETQGEETTGEVRVRPSPAPPTRAHTHGS